MTKEPAWVSVDDAISLNKVIVAATGEPHGVLGRGMVDTGLARPKFQFHYGGETHISRLAAHMIYGVGKNHGFQQGNQRTAWACARYFIHLNGYDVRQSVDAEINNGWQLKLAKLVEALMSDDSVFDELVLSIGVMLVPVGR